ncbi:MAG: caspase family protein [Stenomitos rutilans HA7619-LM2]|jgi:hypothetical protein|nr:caspase family protein [Stenomitos rutilans HA7619-LM2]
MQKLALVIGVSEYESGLPPLPSAIRDVEAMRRVLEHPEMGNFNQVKSLLNPDPKTMEEEIEILFSGRTREDLVVLFFSGHGILDEKDKLYFSTRTTRKLTGNNFVKTSMVSARFVQERMSDAGCQQILILDCCYSGAIADGLLMKGDEILDVKVDVKNQLSGEGRAVLTSSTGTQYSLAGKQDGELSVYTQYIVEGIETGVGDADCNGQISAVELHNYAKREVLAATENAMHPKIYSIGEGFNIIIAEALKKDPEQIYCEEVQRFCQKGKLSLIGTLRYRDRRVLCALSRTLKLTIEQATAIEREVLQAHRERQQKLRLFWQIVEPILAGKEPVTSDTRRTLLRLQRMLDLRLEEIDPALAGLLNPNLGQPASLRKQVRHYPRSRHWWLLRGLLGVGAALSIGASSLPLRLDQYLPAPIAATLHTGYLQLSEVSTQLSTELFPDTSMSLLPEITWQMMNGMRAAIHSTEQATHQTQAAKRYDQVKAGVAAWKKANGHWTILVQQVRQQYIAGDDATEIKVLKDMIAQQRRANLEWQSARQYLAALELANQANLDQIKLEQQGDKTKQAWQSVASKWQEASHRMNSIRSGASAERGQQKAREYQNYAKVADKQAQRLCKPLGSCGR